MDISNTPQPFRYRHDGWTPARQRDFLVALAESGCLTDACRTVGISTTSAYRARRRMADFAAAWDRALARMAPVLEHAAYVRAVEGWDEPIVHGGKVVAHKRRYSDALLRLLIQRAAAVPSAIPPAPGSAEAVAAAREAAALAGGRFVTPASAAETDARLRAGLDALAARIARDEAAGDGGADAARDRG